MRDFADATTRASVNALGTDGFVRLKHRSPRYLMTQDFVFSSLDGRAWHALCAQFAAEIHPVDREACTIWFSFFPEALSRALQEAPDRKLAEFDMLLRGNWRLEEQIDSSHWFLYGHRYWQFVKEAMAGDSGEGDAASVIRRVARSAAQQAKVDPSLTTAMALIGYRTLQFVGLEAFRKGSGTPRQRPDRTPEQVLAQRQKAPDRGLLGFLRGAKQPVQITYDEDRQGGQFEGIQNQAITAASVRVGGDYSQDDPRCEPGEGPLPTECRSGKCSKCWVGVLDGKDRLDPITAFERKRLQMFGYLAADNEEMYPNIRLACQAVAGGNVTLVVPSWNGFLSKKDRIRTESVIEGEISRH